MEIDATTCHAYGQTLVRHDWPHYFILSYIIYSS